MHTLLLNHSYSESELINELLQYAIWCKTYLPQNSWCFTFDSGLTSSRPIQPEIIKIGDINFAGRQTYARYINFCNEADLIQFKLTFNVK